MAIQHFLWQRNKEQRQKQIAVTNRRSFSEIGPFSSLDPMQLITLLASLAKSRSRTSCGGTGTMANASLSSLIIAHPTYTSKQPTTDGLTSKL